MSYIHVSDAKRQRNWEEHLASLRAELNARVDSRDEPVLITRIAFPESNYIPPNPDDAPPKGIPFADVPPGKPFRTAEWHRYTKRANGDCVDYEDGGDAFLKPERECFLISLGGWISNAVS